MQFNTENTDQELTLGIKKQSKLAFRILFDRYYNHLLGTVINILKDEVTAKDVVQEVFIKIWEGYEKLDPSQNIGGYLKRAVINRSLNVIRDKKITVDLDEVKSRSNSEINVDKVLEEKELSLFVNKAIEQLPERCRLVYTLKRVEGLTLKEIAEQLSVSTKTVENQMTKALKFLRDAILPYIKYNAKYK